MNKKLITSEGMKTIPVVFQLDEYIKICCHGCEWLNTKDKNDNEICKLPKDQKCDTEMIIFS